MVLLFFIARIKNGFGITRVFIPIIISMYVNLRVYGHVYVYAYLQLVGMVSLTWWSHQGGGAVQGYCVEELVRRTQRCDNHQLMYTTVQSLTGNGFGSEFNFFYVYSLIEAVRRGRRLVYFHSGRAWEYDCAEHYGWGCYFDFHCLQGSKYEHGVPLQDLKLTDVHSTFFDMETAEHSMPIIMATMEQTYSKIFKQSNCIVNQSATNLTTIMANYLYTPNNETRRFIRDFNQYYNISEPYLALQLRLSDKRREMTNDIWQWMTHLNNTYQLMKPYLYPAPGGYRHLYIATDDCGSVQRLVTYIPKGSITVHGPCLSADAAHRAMARTRDKQHADIGHIATLRLMADIDMLVHGAHFFGLMSSNLVRLVYRLRSPAGKNNTHGLAYELTSQQHKYQYDNLIA
jgi:hypothetical protein